MFIVCLMDVVDWLRCITIVRSDWPWSVQYKGGGLGGVGRGVIAGSPTRRKWLANWLIYSVNWTPASLRFDLIKIYSENCIMTTAPPGGANWLYIWIQLNFPVLHLHATVSHCQPQRQSDQVPPPRVYLPPPPTPPDGVPKQWPKQPPVNLDCGYNATGGGSAG